MLFLLKRTGRGGLLGLAVLVPLGLILRHFLGDVPPVGASWQALGLGVAVFVVVAASDVALNALCTAVYGAAYERRFGMLAGLFKDQSLFALLTGAVLAGVGEELVFRGASGRPEALAAGAVLFGLLHHVRGPLWPFTLWAVYQGLLFALALHLTGALFVTMVAHFLHDLSGFLAFRAYNRRHSESAA